MKNIFDKNLFSIHGFHDCEPSNIDASKMCRWTHGIFKIIHEKHVNNICIEFWCPENKELIVFINNIKKNYKYEFKLNLNEYFLYIPVSLGDELNFYVETHIPFKNDDLRKLGIYVRNIFVSDNIFENVNLLEKKDNLSQLNEINFETSLNEKLIVEKSLIEQNPTVEIVDLNYSPREFQFNPCIFEFKDNKYFLTRKCTHVTEEINVNTFNLYKFDSLEKINFKINDEVKFEQYEDPRVFLHNNKIYIGCSNYIHKFLPKIIHQKILVYDENFNHIDNIHPVYGLNKKTIEQSDGQEKNWTYFVYEDRLMCIYKMNPHTVVEFDWQGNMIAEYKTYFNTNNIWKFGECRGGTNPILKDGYYHSFFHSHINIEYKNKKSRKYFIGYYKFESKPPFKIVEISKEPILWGNEKDEMIMDEHYYQVVFPCGAIIKNDKFLVSFGINEEKSGIVTV